MLGRRIFVSAVLGIGMFGMGCEAYQPLLCEPCLDTISCGPGLTCSGGFCGSPTNWCFEERGIEPYFPNTDGECDLLDRVGAIDLSKVTIYTWYEWSQARAIVGAPGAAAPGTLRVTHRSGDPGTETGDAWVESDGSFQMTNLTGAGLGETWFPIDDDGDQCGPGVQGTPKVLWRGPSNTLLFACASAANRPYATRRCLYTGPNHPNCRGPESSPDCPHPHGELCTVAADCLLPEPSVPFPFDETFLGIPTFRELEFGTAALEPGALLVARSHVGDLRFAVAGSGGPLVLNLEDPEDWRVRLDWTLWVEQPEGSPVPSSRTYVVTASMADALRGF